MVSTLLVGVNKNVKCIVPAYSHPNATGMTSPSRGPHGSNVSTSPVPPNEMVNIPGTVTAYITPNAAMIVTSSLPNCSSEKSVTPIAFDLLLDMK